SHDRFLRFVQGERGSGCLRQLRLLELVGGLALHHSGGEEHGAALGRHILLVRQYRLGSRGRVEQADVVDEDVAAVLQNLVGRQVLSQDRLQFVGVLRPPLLRVIEVVEGEADDLQVVGGLRVGGGAIPALAAPAVLAAAATAADQQGGGADTRQSQSQQS